VLQFIWAHQGIHYIIDIDDDGVLDFRISTYGGGGLGGGSGSCNISSFDSHASIASFIDTVTCCCPNQYIINRL